jgi:uncharacterized protein (DUF4415 family)
MKKEYDLKKMKMRRGPVLDPKNTKVQKTFRIDYEIFVWLYEEGNRRGIGYQTLLNMLLRERMQMGESILTESRVREVVREEIKKIKKAG